ncbi:hypothetical protein ASPWEDRAFT_113069 [Aspergillus wentii DTO 134E9]|uniref:Cytochrome b5 heme-binding domain-containing protein n=1 Tax=Aspergillus wentii DTO 134E9 TaxID=1073089 RepID=A0A1L9RI04_ASPWE|nr:uncharacterized protein ASPWEDRAFT_113069 [Aspergillus wentii DTO 134E9]OJJ34566.1 hypothetical protein ASPWEDRAFT_113069 [Aspergillus wentii DTO 134E9]
MAEPPSYTKDDVSKHNSLDDLWVIIDGEIYNLTEFRAEHPGGARMLQTMAGKNASKKFHKYHRSAILSRYYALRVGMVVLKPNRKWTLFSSSFCMTMF